MDDLLGLFETRVGDKDLVVALLFSKFLGDLLEGWNGRRDTKEVLFVLSLSFEGLFAEHSGNTDLARFLVWALDAQNPVAQIFVG